MKITVAQNTFKQGCSKIFGLFMGQRCFLKNDMFFSVCHHPGGSFFIELMLHLSHVKQMYSQIIHLTDQLKLCIQIREEMLILTATPRPKLLAHGKI